MGIELIDTRHETVAVQAAEGYAKVSGNTASTTVCLVLQLHSQTGVLSFASRAVHHHEMQRRTRYKAFMIRCQEAWIRTAQGLISFGAPHNESDPSIDEQNGHLQPYHAIKKLYHYIPSDSIICIDGGKAGGWALQNLPESTASLSVVYTGYLGFLGNGWGYSLGAAVADRSKLIVNIQGDGSAGFHLAELDTYKKFGLRVLTVVVNNEVWDFEIPGPLIGATATLPQSPLDTRRKSFLELGSAGEERWEKALDALGDAVDEIVQSAGPGLIDLRVLPKPHQDMTKSMVGMTRDLDGIVVPYYDNLPRPYYKGKGNKDGEKTRRDNGPSADITRGAD
ncbi:catalytic [Ascochyta rabiei]|uniref:Catalytic n=2 Tax=Didymella rabiei TaxID=5454 RepID=A0A162ZGN4_DIDRA|nr:catalytic [Ascochyta rabiei]